MVTTAAAQSRRVTSHRPRVVTVGVSLVGTLLVALAVSTRWWDTSSLRVPVLQAAFPLIGLMAVAWAALLVVLLRRRIRWAAPAFGVALVPIVLATSSLDATTVAVSADDQVIAASNLQFGRADPDALVALVRELDVDVLVLTELTPEAASALDRSGALSLLPHRVGNPQLGADGTMILSRHPLTAVSEEHVAGLFDQPVASVRSPGGDYVVRAMHPYPPTPALVRGWHRQLNEAADFVAEQPAQTPLVLAGDFNASQAHPAFRRLTSGLVDAHRAVGAGWVRTWPQGGRLPAFVQLDHVLVRRGEVVDAGTHTVEGTDHSLVWARLRLGT